MPQQPDGGWLLDDTEVERPRYGSVEKGYPEFDPDQPRDDGGRWSGGGGGAGDGKPSKWSDEKKREYLNGLAQEAKFPAKNILIHGPGEGPQPDDPAAVPIGMYDPATDQMHIYPRFWQDGDKDPKAMRSVFAHETLHRRIDKVFDEASKEQRAAEKARQIDEHGEIKPQFVGDYPVISALQEAGIGDFNRILKDGFKLTDYARYMVQAVVERQVLPKTGLHEIIAEVAGLKARGPAAYKKASPFLQKLYETFTDIYEHNLAAKYA